MTIAKTESKAEVAAATPGQIVQEKDLKRLYALGEDLKKAVLETGEKYLALCKHIRERQIPPRLVAEELARLGFHKTRISEINRVAQCGDEVWNEFEARSLSFRRVLALERGTVENVAATAAVACGEGETGEGGEGGEGRGEEAVDAEERKRLLIEKMARAAKTILVAAADLEMRSKKWSNGNGYELRLVKSKTVSVKSSKV